MPVRKVKATELVDTNVEFVSFVKRGANRLPFKLLKKDGEIMDLYKIARTVLGKAESRPAIVAAVISKSGDVAKVGKVFKDAGLDPSKFTKSEKDGVVAVAKSDSADAVDTVTVRMGGDYAVVLSNFAKTADDLSDNPFAESLKKGYLNSVSGAAQEFVSGVAAILAKGEAAEATAAALTDYAGAFGQYASTFAMTAPAALFKMDAAGAANMSDIEDASEEEDEKKKKQTEDMEKSMNGTGDGCEDGKGSGTSAKATADDKDGSKVTKATQPGDTGVDPVSGFAHAAADKARAEGDGTADDKKLKQNASGSESTNGNGDNSPTEAKKGEVPDDESGAGAKKAPAQADYNDLQKALEASLQKSADALQKSFAEALSGLQAGFQKSVGELNDRIENVASMARKTDAALNGTVFNEAAGDTERSVKKAESAGAPPLLDTALSRRSA